MMRKNESESLSDVQQFTVDINIFCLLLCTKLFSSLKWKTFFIFLSHAVSQGQEFRKSSAGWFWFRISEKVVVPLSAGLLPSVGWVWSLQAHHLAARGSFTNHTGLSTGLPTTCFPQSSDPRAVRQHPRQKPQSQRCDSNASPVWYWSYRSTQVQCRRRPHEPIKTGRGKLVPHPHTPQWFLSEGPQMSLSVTISSQSPESHHLKRVQVEMGFFGCSSLTTAP